MKKQILFLCAALIGLVAMAQNLTVRGRVISQTDNEPLIGASVSVKGAKNGAVTDFDGNYSHLYREKIHLTKEGASPASEFFAPTAAPKRSAVAWTSYNNAHNTHALAKRAKVERQKRAADNRFSTEVMSAKRAEAKAHKAELRKESLQSELKARKEARKADKWEPHYIVK